MPPQQTLNHGLQVICEASSDPSILNKEKAFKPPTLIREEAFYFPFKKNVKKEDTQCDQSQEEKWNAELVKHQQ